MHNLKKLLALVIAFVMALSLMTIANADDTSGFSDANTIKHTDQVNLLTSIGIVKGYEDGTFKGNAPVTRAEMAKLITAIALGSDFDKVAANFTSEGVAFTDVANSHWANPYIAFCVAQGYIKGYDDGTFRPDRNITSVEAATMLLRVLGYDKNGEYEGKNWNNGMPVMQDSVLAGLFKELALAKSDVVDRDSAATMIYNTLFSQTKGWSAGIGYWNNGSLAVKMYGLDIVEGIITNVSSDAVYIDGVKYPGVVTEYTNIGLKASIAAKFKTKEAAGLVSYSEVLDYTKPLTAYSKNVTLLTTPTVVSFDGTSIAELTTVGNDKYKATLETGVEYYLNGVKTTAGNIGIIGIGDVVKLIDNNSNGYMDVVSVWKYTVGKVNYIDNTAKTISVGTVTIPFASAVGYEKLAKGDVAYYYENAQTYYLFAAQKMVGRPTNFISKTNAYTVSNVNYMVSARAISNNMTLGNTYTILLDSNNCIICVDYKAENVEYMLGVDNNAFNVQTRLTDAVVVTSDGKQENVTLAGIGSGAENYRITAGEIKDNLYTYEKNAAGNYVLTPVAALSGWTYYTNGTFTNSAVNATTSEGTIRVDSATRFVDVKDGKVYSGYNTIKSMTNARGWYQLDDDNMTAVIIYVIDRDQSVAADEFMIYDTNYTRTASGTYYYNAYYNKQLVDVLVSAGVHAAIQTNGVGVYTVTSETRSIIDGVFYDTFASRWYAVNYDRTGSIGFSDGNIYRKATDTVYVVFDLNKNEAKVAVSYEQAAAFMNRSDLTGAMAIYVPSLDGRYVEQVVLFDGYTLAHGTATLASDDAYGADSGVIYGPATATLNVVVTATPGTRVTLRNHAGSTVGASKTVPSTGSVNMPITVSTGIDETYTIRYELSDQFSVENIPVKYTVVYPVTVTGGLATKVAITGTALHTFGTTKYVEAGTNATLTLTTTGTLDTYKGTTYFFDKGFSIDSTNFAYEDAATTDGLTATKDMAHNTFEASYVWTASNVTADKTYAVAAIAQDVVIPVYTMQWFVVDKDFLYMVFADADGNLLTAAQVTALGLTSADITVAYNGTNKADAKAMDIKDAGQDVWGASGNASFATTFATLSNKDELAAANAGVIVYEMNDADEFASGTDATKVAITFDSNVLRIASNPTGSYSVA